MLVFSRHVGLLVAAAALGLLIIGTVKGSGPDVKDQPTASDVSSTNHTIATRTVPEKNAESASTEESVDPERIAALVTQLGAARFEDRQQAGEQLLAFGPVILDQLAKQYRRNHDFEIRLQLYKLARELFCRRVLHDKAAFLGVQIQPRYFGDDPRFGAYEDRTFLEVRWVVPGSPGAKAGLQVGDVLLTADGEPIGSVAADFTRQLQKPGPGTKVELVIDRGGQRLTIKVILGYRPLPYYQEPSLASHLERALIKFEQWWAGCSKAAAKQ